MEEIEIAFTHDEIEALQSMISVTNLNSITVKSLPALSSAMGKILQYEQSNFFRKNG